MTLPICHPLDPLSADEIKKAATLVRELRQGDTFIFNSISLKEPNKQAVLEYDASQNDECTVVEREALIITIDRPSGKVHEIIVSLTDDKIKNTVYVPNVQPTLHPQEMLEAEQAMLKDESIIEECRKCGITDMSTVFADPWAVGFVEEEELKPRRLMQALVYMRTCEDDNQYAHPLDFLPLIDVNTLQVVKINHCKPRSKLFGRATIPLRNHNFLPKFMDMDSFRTDIKPIQVLQPEGVSYTTNGNQIKWQKWDFRISFNYREGLTIHNVSYMDGDQKRSLLYRMSLSEMVVPYADPAMPHARKQAFDVGEYGLGYCANSLSLGCDCLGTITYFDAIISDINGDPMVIPDCICLHEEDAGVLAKHTDYRNGKAHTIRSRRLVVSQMVTVANYSYLLYFYFYQDGTMQYEIKATGELNTHALAEDESPKPYGTIVAPQVVGQHHQHLFTMRIVPMVDGLQNSVEQVDVQAVDIPVGHPDNQYGNAFAAVSKIFNDTSEAQAVANLSTSRSWKIINENSLHPYTKDPVGYKLVSLNTPPLLAKPGSIVHRRANFASKTLWSDGSDALNIWAQSKDSIRDTQVTLYFTFGATHLPTVENFPIMTVENCGFM
ncbi:hypothetical protein NQZ79_g1549 [Umbelopsis isabellina]|nr:hypothetical protein NQZ79_g1549 [Umbelopsis isabellina]